MQETDICIIGGGIMGCSTAYWLSKLSRNRILLLDQYGIGNDRGSSSDVNRVFRFSYGRDEMYTHMAAKSLDYWLALEKESNEQLLVQTGLLMLDGSDESATRFNRSSYETLTHLDYGAEEIDGHDLKLRFPQFHGDHAYFDPHGGVLLASKVLHTFERIATTRKVEFLTRKVSKIVDSESPIVRLETGDEIRTRKLVVTTGSWSNNILRPGLPEMVPRRQQLFYFKPKQNLENFRPFSFPVFFTDQYYGLPATGIDAVKVSPKELHEKVSSPDNAKWSIDQDQLELCRELCRKYIPELANAEMIRSRICFYDMTNNTDFVIDRDMENNNIVYAYGFSGHGFKFAVLVGKLLAELVLDETPSFSLDRFTTRPEDRPILTHGQLGQGE